MLDILEKWKKNFFYKTRTFTKSKIFYVNCAYTFDMSLDSPWKFLAACKFPEFYKKNMCLLDTLKVDFLYKSLPLGKMMKSLFYKYIFICQSLEINKNELK